LNLFQSNIATNVSDVVNESISNINTEIETVINNTITQTNSIEQEINFTIGPNGIVEVDGDCNFNQESTIAMMASNVSESITSVIQKSKAGQQLESEFDQVAIPTRVVFACICFHIRFLFFVF
jgi:hypothetical protein